MFQSFLILLNLLPQFDEEMLVAATEMRCDKMANYFQAGDGTCEMILQIRFEGL